MVPSLESSVLHKVSDNMLKPPRRQSRNIKDPDFAIKLAKAVARMAKVNSRIDVLSMRLATTSKNGRELLSRPSASSSPPNKSESSEQRLASRLLNAFEISSNENQDPKSKGLRERELVLDRARSRAAARENARLRFANMYRRFVQRRFPLTWEDVLRQE